MPLTTPQAIITLGLKSAGILGVGQTALAEDYSDVYDVLNGMLAQWNQRRWLIYHLIDVSIPTTGAVSYTVGAGGDFNTPRPSRLEAAFLRQTITGAPNFVDYPLQILQSREDYNLVQLKTLQSWPYFIFYDAAYPLGSVYPWPVAQASLFDLHLTLKATLAQFTSYTQTIDLPDEYKEAIWTNLAIRIAVIYPGSKLPDWVVGLAASSLETIRVANTQIPLLQIPGGLGRRLLYNIYSGQPY